MIVLAFHLQNIILILVILGLAAFRPRHAKDACIRIVAAWSLAAGVFVAGLWYYPPGFARWGLAAILIVASVVHLSRVRAFDSRALLRLSHFATLASFTLGFALLWQALAGQIQPTMKTIDLAPPMASSSNICVLSGGSSIVLNLHFVTSKSPDGLFEKHSIDFVKHDAWGNRTKRFGLHPQPQNIESYLVFDEPVFAPCRGQVVAMENDKPDHPAGTRFRDRSGSNFVTLRCGRTDVILAHLKQGSLKVALGQQIETGTLLGKIGHSGNTEEPHLHINAQTIANSDQADSYPEPVIMTFDGRYLVRGDCL